jgi:hypothetical protein
MFSSKTCFLLSEYEYFSREIFHGPFDQRRSRYRWLELAGGSPRYFMFDHIGLHPFFLNPETSGHRTQALEVIDPQRFHTNELFAQA